MPPVEGTVGGNWALSEAPLQDGQFMALIRSVMRNVAAYCTAIKYRLRLLSALDLLMPTH